MLFYQCITLGPTCRYAPLFVLLNLKLDKVTPARFLHILFSSFYLMQRQANFSVKGQIVHILGFADCIKSLSHILFSPNHLFFNLFLAALGLPCCVWAFSNCGQRGLLFIVVCRLLIAVASLVAEHRLQARGLSSCGTWAQQLWHTGSRAQAQQLCLMSLVAPWHVGSSQTRDRTHVPCIGRRIPNHCGTREAFYYSSYIYQLAFLCKKNCPSFPPFQKMFLESIRSYRSVSIFSMAAKYAECVNLFFNQNLQSANCASPWRCNVEHKYSPCTHGTYLRMGETDINQMIT